MNKKVRTISESFIDLYLGIPTLILAGPGMVVLPYLDNYGYDFDRSVFLVIILIFYFVYINFYKKSYDKIKEVRKLNEIIVNNGIKCKCSVIGKQFVHYGHTMLHSRYTDSITSYVKTFRLIIQYQYGNENRIGYSDILYKRYLYNVDCNEVYVLDDKIYPILIKRRNDIKCTEFCPENYEEIKALKYIRSENFVINFLICFMPFLLIFVELFARIVYNQSFFKI